MSWVFLGLAALFEAMFAALLPVSNGFTRIMPTACVLALGICSLWALSRALTGIPLSVAYTIWVGAGALSATLTSIIAYRQHVSISDMLCLTLIIVGTIGLKFANG